jgi:hypothetical protein
MNFSIALLSGKIKGLQIDSERLLQGAASDSQRALATLEISLLAGDVSRQTHDAITKQLDSPQQLSRQSDKPGKATNVATIAGLILGSPEFQRR